MNRPEITADVRQFLEDERRAAIRRANEIAALLGMRELVKVDRSEPRPAWRSDDGVRTGRI